MKKLPDKKEVSISCPKCGYDTKLIVRTNRDNGSQFLGCPSWPECKHTRPIPETLRMELAGQPKLF